MFVCVVRLLIFFFIIFSSANGKQLENQLRTTRSRMIEWVTEKKRVINVELEIHQMWSKHQRWRGKIHFTAVTRASLTNKFHEPKKAVPIYGFKIFCFLFEPTKKRKRCYARQRIWLFFVEKSLASDCAVMWSCSQKSLPLFSSISVLAVALRDNRAIMKTQTRMPFTSMLEIAYAQIQIVNRCGSELCRVQT